MTLVTPPFLQDDKRARVSCSTFIALTNSGELREENLREIKDDFVLGRLIVNARGCTLMHLLYKFLPKESILFEVNRLIAIYANLNEISGESLQTGIKFYQVVSR